MSIEIHNYYQNITNCNNDLTLARKTFSNRHTTRVQYDHMIKALNLMYSHCPNSLENVVMAILDESHVRRTYFVIKWNRENGSDS